ncbi:hypothetical protein BMS3Abin07_00448 [bacterium BMS3Abin07]|nr:hypothetical protein BMS3Abin07_00448 [bacterium BMS3Abin07]GBE32741.1 hypothetical protein BMS3Bbin05_01660 [bacterium BMS3Bbin05]HDL21043.1 hypothetical protein [Nitrospirota bacterium]HDO23468.1 hypothetical protein [Nitrospirota bacterium]HDZ88988.1 hypothetical protein [Nitrospirota bacterium]
MVARVDLAPPGLFLIISLLEAIELKEEMENKGIEEGARFTFYHDTSIRACKFDEEGNIVEKWKG